MFPCKARPLVVRWALCASVSGGPLILFAMGAIMEYRVRQRFMCLLEFLYWASLCSNSYLSQLLRETGMSGVAVGSAMAAIAFVGMAAPPVFGIISDKIGSSRRVFILCWFVTAAAWLWVPLTGSTMLGGLSLAVIVMVGGSAFRLSAASILDSWMLPVSYTHLVVYKRQHQAPGAFVAYPAGGVPYPKHGLSLIHISRC